MFLFSTPTWGIALSPIYSICDNPFFQYNIMLLSVIHGLQIRNMVSLRLTWERVIFLQPPLPFLPGLPDVVGWTLIWSKGEMSQPAPLLQMLGVRKSQAHLAYFVGESHKILCHCVIPLILEYQTSANFSSTFQNFPLIVSSYFHVL